MDAQPWPGYAWHVLEHFAALARLQLLRLLQRWDLPQRAHVQLLQCYGTGCGVKPTGGDLPSGKHTKNYGKIHHFSWENSL